jgi:hypothetical protein
MNREVSLLVTYYFIIIIIIISGVRLSPHGTAATAGLLCQCQMIDDADCGVKIGGGNRSTLSTTNPT